MVGRRSLELKTTPQLQTMRRAGVVLSEALDATLAAAAPGVTTAELDAVFAGNDALPGGNDAPSIRSPDLLAGGWTISNLAYALRTGITPSGDAFGGSMGEVVMYGTSFLTQADLEAMATYLLDSDVAGIEMAGVDTTEGEAD